MSGLHDFVATRVTSDRMRYGSVDLGFRGVDSGPADFCKFGGFGGTFSNPGRYVQWTSGDCGGPSFLGLGFRL